MNDIVIQRKERANPKDIAIERKENKRKKETRNTNDIAIQEKREGADNEL